MADFIIDEYAAGFVLLSASIIFGKEEACLTASNKFKLNIYFT